MRLTAEVLRLRLRQANLVTTGTKKVMVQRLMESEPTLERGSADHSSSSESSSAGEQRYTTSQSSANMLQHGAHLTHHRYRADASASSSASSRPAARGPTGHRRTAAPACKLDQARRPPRRHNGGSDQPIEATKARSPSHRSRLPRSHRSMASRSHRLQSKRPHSVKQKHQGKASKSSSSSSSRSSSSSSFTD